MVVSGSRHSGTHCYLPRTPPSLCSVALLSVTAAQSDVDHVVQSLCNQLASPNEDGDSDLAATALQRVVSQIDPTSSIAKTVVPAIAKRLVECIESQRVSGDGAWVVLSFAVCDANASIGDLAMMPV